MARTVPLEKDCLGSQSSCACVFRTQPRGSPPPMTDCVLEDEGLLAWSWDALTCNLCSGPSTTLPKAQLYLDLSQQLSFDHLCQAAPSVVASRGSSLGWQVRNHPLGWFLRDLPETLAYPLPPWPSPSLALTFPLHVTQCEHDWSVPPTHLTLDAVYRDQVT